MQRLKALHKMKSSNKIDKTIKLRENMKLDEKGGDRSSRQWVKFQELDDPAND